MSPKIRSSSHAHTGFVAVHQFSTAVAAGHFAGQQAQQLGHSIFVRRPGHPAGHPSAWSVSVPVSQPSPAAVRFVSPAPAPGGRCQATTRAGGQCSRKASHGHYCKQHFGLVG